MRSTRKAAGRHIFERGEAVMAATVDIGNFSMEFIVPGRRVKALKQVSLSIAPGEIVGLVGESGSGKSTLAMAMARLLPRGRYQVTGGEFRVLGRDILNAPERELERLRGADVSFIFQEPMNALNPTRKIGRQLLDVIEKHSGMSGQQARTRGLALLEEMQIRDPQRVFDDYPHALSGGMRQRVLIAMAFANDPQLLIADEPTTALDVTVQAEILRMIRDQARRRGTTVLFVSHDMALVSQLCDRVAVLYRGKLVESGATAAVIGRPCHPYTRDLMAASVLTVKADSGGDPAAEETTPLLQVDGLHLWYGARSWTGGNTRRLHALKGVSLTLQPGRTLGVIGESGSGKSSLANAVLGLVKPSLGRIKICGREITGSANNPSRGATPLIQLVFQDPQGSFNPRRKVWRLVSEPLAVQGRHKRAELRSCAAQMLEKVGLGADYLDRFPHELSGGQRQRLAIARALILKPRILVLDEPTSALDVSVQAQILQLLQGLQREEGLGYLFISHDISVVAHLSDNLMVMRHGEVVEQGEAKTVLSAPRETYTRQLLDAAPLIGRDALKLTEN